MFWLWIQIQTQSKYKDKYKYKEITWGPAGCCSDCEAAFSHSFRGCPTDQGHSGGVRDYIVELFSEFNEFKTGALYIFTDCLYLKTSVDVVTKLVSQVHAGAHRWTLCLYIPEEGHRKVEGGEVFFTLFMLNIALCSNISCRFGTSFVVTAYFTSKATFVQMFKCFHPAGWRPGKVNQALIWESLLRRAPLMCANVYFSIRENKGIPIFKVLLKKMTTLEMFCRSSG